MKINANTLFRLAAVLFAAAVLAGCSLLKVAVATGEPLSKEDARTRTLTRGFYYDFASEVARAADSIAVTTTDSHMRIAATRWKIRATRAGINAVMQGIPDVALADMWILCRRQNAAFAAAPDSLLFGPQSDLARRTAARLDKRVERLAGQLLTAERAALMTRFVDDYVRDNPALEGSESANTTLAWIEYLERSGVQRAYPTGSIAEVLSDVNDRVSGQTQQLSRSIGWSKDVIQMQLQQDSLRTRLGAQLDSLERGFDRMATVAEHLPEISDHMMQELSRQVTQIVGTMNWAVDNAFENLDRQRAELQNYISVEREVLISEARTAANEAVRDVLDGLPGLIGKVLLYVVLALVVLLGLPFAAGFWLGRWRERSGRKKQGTE